MKTTKRSMYVYYDKNGNKIEVLAIIDKEVALFVNTDNNTIVKTMDYDFTEDEYLLSYINKNIGEDGFVYVNIPEYVIEFIEDNKFQEELCTLYDLLKKYFQNFKG